MSMSLDVAIKGGDRTYLPWNEFIPLAGGVGIHGHDDHENDIKHLLLIVEDIMSRTTFSVPGISEVLEARTKKMEDGIESGFSGVMEHFASTITNLSREMTSKLGENEDEKTSRILKALANHSWKAKVVLVLAAFTVKYGKLRMLQLLNSDPLASSLALLKQQPDVPERPAYLISWYKALAKLIKAMLDLTNSIIDFKNPEPQHASLERSDMIKGDFRIPTAVYWTINSVVVCSSQIMAVLVMRYKNLAPYEWYLDDLTRALDSLQRDLSKQEKRAPPQEHVDERPQLRAQPKGLDLPERPPSLTFLQRLCMLKTPPVQSNRHTMSYRKVCSDPESHVMYSNPEDENSNAEAYEAILHLFSTNLASNMDIFKAFVDQQDQPLLDGSTKERVSIEVLKEKIVLLFIADLDVHHEEFLKFDEMFGESRKQPTSPTSQYEILWLPMVDRSMTWKEKRNQFETIQFWMPWYSVYYPSLINPAANRYIHEVWQFSGKPLVVVLDSQGKVVNLNAIHMIRIWGSQAFPFSHLREETLWNSTTCMVDLLLNNIYPELSDRIEEDKYICFYGGEDKEWIGRFTTTAREIAKDMNISLELIYMGKSCLTDLVQSNINTIASENLSHVFQDSNLMKAFWLRLESIVQSRLSVINSAENDLLTQEIKTLLGFDKYGNEWALISRKGSMLIAKADGDALLKSFMEYDKWKDNAAGTSLVIALSDYLDKLQNPNCSNHPNSTEVPIRTPHQSNGNFLWRSLSCFVDPPTN